MCRSSSRESGRAAIRALSWGRSFRYRLAASLAVLAALAALTAADRAHAAPPDAPKFDPLGGDRRATLIWEVPEDGGTPLTRYEYRYTSTGTFPNTWTTVPNGIALEPTAGESIVYAVPDRLTNGTDYTFELRAVNADGAGPASDGPVTPAANTAATAMFDDAFSGDMRVPGTVLFKIEAGLDLLIQDSDRADKAGSGLKYFSFVYRWFRVDGSTETPVKPPQPNGTAGSAYVLTDADAGKKLKVTVSFFDDNGNPEVVSAVFPSGAATILPRAPCPAPSYTGGAVQVWTGTATMIPRSTPSGDATQSYGIYTENQFDTAQFTAGGNAYTIDGAYRAVAGNEAGKLVFGLTSDLDTADRQRLALHVCNRSFRFADATRDRFHDYLWDSDLDWSDVIVRTLYLSYDAVPPAITRAARTGASLKLTFGEDLDPDSAPAPSAFTVKVDGAAADFAPGSRSAIDGRTVTLTLDSAPPSGSQVTVSYDMQVAGGALRDPALNPVRSFVDLPVPLAARPDDTVVPWLARFGRTAAGQVADAVASRLAAPRRPGLEVSLGGQRLAGVSPRDIEEPEARAGDMPQGTESRTLTGREFLTGSSFNLFGGTEEAGMVGVWGRVALAGFEGRDDGLSIDGEVASAMLGADYARGRAAVGMLLSRAEGEGEYRSSDDRGGIESTLTGIYPYMRYAASDRLSVWGTAGYGLGTLTLKPEGQSAIGTDMDLTMVAAGLRGVLQRAGEGRRLELAAVADALGVRTTSERVDDGGRTILRSAEADVTRLRLGIEGTLHGIEVGEHRLVPTLELAARHDGGDAESGYGLDIGVGLAWSDPRAGIEVTIRGRGLVSHEADGFRQGGGSVSLAWDPDPASRRGLSLSLVQTVGGPASGGAGALPARRISAGLAANDDGGMFDNRRLEAKLGYGIALPGGRFMATPEAGFALSETHRELGLGWRVGLARRHRVSLGLDLRATRREAANGDRPPEHGVGVRLTAGW